MTFPIVVTTDPETGEPHTGIYRLQQVRPDTLGFHAQIHRVGPKQPTEVGRPGHPDGGRGGDRGRPGHAPLASLAPVPEGISNYVFASFLREAPLELVRARTVDLEVPAESEIVLEGYVDPSEEKVEGPFGDHTGYYSAARDRFP